MLWKVDEEAKLGSCKEIKWNPAWTKNGNETSSSGQHCCSLLPRLLLSLVTSSSVQQPFDRLERMFLWLHRLVDSEQYRKEIKKVETWTLKFSLAYARRKIYKWRYRWHKVIPFKRLNDQRLRQWNSLCGMWIVVDLCRSRCWSSTFETKKTFCVTHSVVSKSFYNYAGAMQKVLGKPYLRVRQFYALSFCIFRVGAFLGLWGRALGGGGEVPQNPCSHDQKWLKFNFLNAWWKRRIRLWAGIPASPSCTCQWTVFTWGEKMAAACPRWYNAALTHTKWMGNPSSPTLSSNCENRRACFCQTSPGMHVWGVLVLIRTVFKRSNRPRG